MEQKTQKLHAKLLRDCNKLLKDAKNSAASPKFVLLLTLPQNSDEYKVLLAEQTRKNTTRAIVEKKVAVIREFIFNQRNLTKEARAKYLIDLDVKTVQVEINASNFVSEYLN
jgi:hypothetical protein